MEVDIDENYVPRNFNWNNEISLKLNLNFLAADFDYYY
jgi:hypothetical protein